MARQPFSDHSSRLSSQGREGLPDSLRHVESPRTAFDDAGDPFLRIQRRELEKTETRRREAMGGGSQMVKKDKPFPDLRPKNDHGQVKDAFDRKWRTEQSRARPHPSKALEQTNRHDPFDKISHQNLQARPKIGRER